MALTSAIPQVAAATSDIAFFATPGPSEPVRSLDFRTEQLSEDPLRPRPVPKMLKFPQTSFFAFLHPLSFFVIVFKRLEKVAEVANQVADKGFQTMAGTGSKAARLEEDLLTKGQLQMTPLGSHLARLPTDARLAKFLVYGCLFRVPSECLTIAAVLSARSPFCLSFNKNQSNDDKGKGKGKNNDKAPSSNEDPRLSWMTPPTKGSDMLLFLQVFDAWQKVKSENNKGKGKGRGGKSNSNSSNLRKWCKDQGLDPVSMDNIADVRRQLHDQLIDQHFLPKQARLDTTMSEDGLNYLDCLQGFKGDESFRRKCNLVRGALCAAFWPSVALFDSSSGMLEARHARQLFFHPSSIMGEPPGKGGKGKGKGKGKDNTNANAQKQAELGDLFDAYVFLEKTQTVGQGDSGAPSKRYIRQVSGVTDVSMLLFAQHLDFSYIELGKVIVDGWMVFQVAPKEASMISVLREQLQRVLRHSFKRHKDSDEKARKTDDAILNAAAQLLSANVI